MRPALPVMFMAMLPCATALMVQPASVWPNIRQPSLLLGERMPRCCHVLASEKNEAAAPTLRERLRLFQRLALPYFEQAEGAKFNFGLLLLLVLVDAGISVAFSYTGRDFYSALSAKDEALFLEKTAAFAVGLVVATPITVLFRFRAIACWRRKQSKRADNPST